MHISEYYTGFKGYLFTFGYGPYFILNRWFPVTLGISFTFTYAHIKFDKAVPLYNSNDREYSFYSFPGIILSIGVHF